MGSGQILGHCIFRALPRLPAQNLQKISVCILESPLATVHAQFSSGHQIWAGREQGEGRMQESPLRLEPKSGVEAVSEKGEKKRKNAN